MLMGVSSHVQCRKRHRGPNRGRTSAMEAGKQTACSGTQQLPLFLLLFIFYCLHAPVMSLNLGGNYRIGDFFIKNRSSWYRGRNFIITTAYSIRVILNLSRGEMQFA